MSETITVGAKRISVFLEDSPRGGYNVMIGGRWYGDVHHSEKYPRYWVVRSTKGMLLIGPYDQELPHNRLFPTRESAIIRLLEREGISC